MHPFPFKPASIRWCPSPRWAPKARTEPGDSSPPLPNQQKKKKKRKLAPSFGLCGQDHQGDISHVCLSVCTYLIGMCGMSHFGTAPMDPPETWQSWEVGVLEGFSPWPSSHAKMWTFLSMGRGFWTFEGFQIVRILSFEVGWDPNLHDWSKSLENLDDGQICMSTNSQGYS